MSVFWCLRVYPCPVLPQCVHLLCEQWSVFDTQSPSRWLIMNGHKPIWLKGVCCEKTGGRSSYITFSYSERSIHFFSFHLHQCSSYSLFPQYLLHPYNMLTLYSLPFFIIIILFPIHLCLHHTTASFSHHPHLSLSLLSFSFFFHPLLFHSL